LAGTDTLMPWVVPGDALHREMFELEVALGSAEAALAAATTVNGRHLASGEIGLIAPGARADILLVDEDPTERLASLREWRILFADGRRYERETLDEWLNEYRQHFHDWFQRHIMATVAGAAVGLFDHS
jgi:cytosine/adenosine deaminase-related metal-dependent hydrolase